MSLWDSPTPLTQDTKWMTIIGPSDNREYPFPTKDGIRPMPVNMYHRTYQFADRLVFSPNEHPYLVVYCETNKFKYKLVGDDKEYRIDILRHDIEHRTHKIIVSWESPELEIKPTFEIIQPNFTPQQTLECALYKYITNHEWNYNHVYFEAGSKREIYEISRSMNSTDYSFMLNVERYGIGPLLHDVDVHDLFEFINKHDITAIWGVDKRYVITYYYFRF